MNMLYPKLSLEKKEAIVVHWDQTCLFGEPGLASLGRRRLMP